jgi:transcriptional regulator with XRE-family HTH domain
MKVQALVARNLRRLRVQQNLSQENLDVDAGVDLSYISRLEWGRENPTVGILERLARALSAEIVEFFAAPAKNEPPPKPLRGGRHSRK